MSETTSEYVFDGGKCVARILVTGGSEDRQSARIAELETEVSNLEFVCKQQADKIDELEKRDTELIERVHELEEAIAELKPVAYPVSEVLPERVDQAYSREVAARNKDGYVHYNASVHWDGLLTTWYDENGQEIENIVDWWEMPPVPPMPEDRRKDTNQ